MVNSPARTPLDSALLFLATGLGAGRLPVAPGTWGSLVGLAAAWGLSYCAWEWRLVAAIAGLLIGIPLCTRAGILLAQADPGSV
ncbi:MAG: phosphatidylglycerophosphatase A, partial [Planctomycetaceae bacterium]